MWVWGPVSPHRALVSEGPTLDSVLCCRCIKILNHLCTDKFILPWVPPAMQRVLLGHGGPHPWGTVSWGWEATGQNAVGQLHARGRMDCTTLERKPVDWLNAGTPNTGCFFQQSLPARMAICSSGPGMTLVCACGPSVIISSDAIHYEKCPSLDHTYLV